MLILKLLGKVLLIPAWIGIAVITLAVSAIVSILGIARGISGLVLTLLLVGTIICYSDFTQAFFLGTLIASGYLLLFAGVTIEVVLETVRNKVGKMILA